MERRPPNATVTLLLNGRMLQSKTVDVPENGRGQVEFLGLDAPYGFSRGEVRIDGGDALAGRRSLFLLGGARRSAQGLVRRRWTPSARRTVFPRRARFRGRWRISDGNPASGIGRGRHSFDAIAFVVLSDLGNVPQELDSALQNYVRNGGSVLVALGPAAAVLPRVPILDEAIQASSYAGREGDRFLTVTDVDAGHPALRSVDRFNGVKFYQAIHVNPTKSRVLAKMNDQTPLVLERNIGEGKVLAFTSTFDNVLERSADACLVGSVRLADGSLSGRRRSRAARESSRRFLRGTALGG